jgi:predicted RNA-binding Zn-ribbon protein involved in translation (DUF1610 family)
MLRWGLVFKPFSNTRKNSDSVDLISEKSPAINSVAGSSRAEGDSVHTVETGSDQCPDCGHAMEIVEVRFGFFRGTTMRFSCPGCGFARADSPAPVSIRDWVAGLRLKDSVAVSQTSSA